MSSFNEQLKRISSNEVLIVIILLYTLGFGLKFFDIIKIRFYVGGVYPNVNSYKK